jgi:hypothetical protein
MAIVEDLVRSLNFWAGVDVRSIETHQLAGGRFSVTLTCQTDHGARALYGAMVKNGAEVVDHLVGIADPKEWHLAGELRVGAIDFEVWGPTHALERELPPEGP